MSFHKYCTLTIELRGTGMYIGPSGLDPNEQYWYSYKIQPRGLPTVLVIHTKSNESRRVFSPYILSQSPKLTI